ncbi:MAG: FAD-binding protein [Firmicutes bacterium]|nr:FAD-binding protein [Bacillota bacterium]
MAYVVGNDCVYCEKCVVECPVQAIFYGRDSMVIDPEKCVCCGICAEICNMSAPYDINDPPTVPKKHGIIEKNCGLVVLGGGGAGLVAAARTACLTDEKIIVLEKGKKTGGGAWFAADFKVFNSKWQFERGIPDILNQSELAAMDHTYWKLDPHLVDRCFRATGEFFDWLCEMGENVEENFKEGTYIFDGPNGPRIPVFKKMRYGRQGGTGKFVMDEMLCLCEKLGVEVLTQHKAADVVIENGRITAVIAEDLGGQTRINCKACVVATGSWINNQEILKKCTPEFAQFNTAKSPHRNPNYTGDGIALAEKAGAFVDYNTFCLRLMGPIVTIPNMTISSITSDPSVIYVNKEGKRWINERTSTRKGIFHTAVTMQAQPEGMSFILFDQSLLETAIKNFKAGKRVDNGFFGVVAYPDNWQEELELALLQFGHILVKGDTVEELAQQIDVDATALSETIKRYNMLCEKGRDNDFFKRPEEMVPFTKAPYYAAICRMATDGAFGGVLVNADMQAYTKDGSLVEGFYVVGDFASGRFINMNGVKRQIINDLAWAFSSGFIAGETAASYLNEHK